MMWLYIPSIKGKKSREFILSKRGEMDFHYRRKNGKSELIEKYKKLAEVGDT